MNVNPLASSANTDPSTPPLTSAQGSDQLFLQLLVAQLKNQTPLDPVDANQFASQLVQFNMLDQLVQIRQLLTPPATPTDATANTNATQGAS